MNDPYNLERFVEAQAPVFEQVCSELREGRKTGHWMWFIFPQIHGLGSSFMAREFAIGSLAEAQEYLKHPILGPRLRECARLVNEVKDRSIHQILGYPDDLKFRSSMTLFAHAAFEEPAHTTEPGAVGEREFLSDSGGRAGPVRASDNQVFLDALQKYFAGDFDRLTLERL